MNKRTQLWPRIASALIMTLAAGVAWGVLTAWGGYLISQFWGTTELVYESVLVMPDGTPIIQSSSSNWITGVTYRTLDGQPFEPGSQERLSPAYFQKPLRPPGVIDTPVPWSQRVAAVSDQQRPPTGWYLIRDDEPLGHGYFVGYDELSKLRVGYIGRNGFRRALPPRDEWFDLGRHTFDYWSSVIASSGRVQYRARAYSYQVSASEQRLPMWVAFLIDGDRLVEIDFRARSVRTVLVSPGLMHVGVVTEPLAPGEAVAIRKADRIVVLDPPTGEKREFMLPETLRSEVFHAYVVGQNELMLQWWNEGFRRGVTTLFWLQPDGSIAREQTLVLMNPSSSSMSEHATAWAAAAVAPVPLGWLTVLGVVLPVGWLQSNQVATYAEGLAKGLDIAWMPLIVVLLLGVALAWFTYRLQRKYRRPATGAWSTFVFLFGVPGFIAYWLEHRRAKLESCAECGEVVPRDRDACAACDAAFPAPAPVGTEIFA